MMVAVLAVLSCSPAAARAAPLFGFNENWFADGHHLAASKPFRPTVQRLQLDWSIIERARGNYDWAPFDAVYRGMVAQGAPPIALVVGTPCWAVSDPACEVSRAIHAVPPLHLDAWERFVQEAVRRYPRLAALEIWNEPNIKAFHRPVPDVAAYVELLRRAFWVSKAERPSLPVLGGSLAAVTTRRRARRDGGFPRKPPARYPYARFLSAMYRLGAAFYMDGLAFHPYPNFAPYVGGRRRHAGVRRGFRRGIRQDIRKQIRMIRRIQRRYDAPAPIWATETGVCTTGPRERRASAREQAVALRQIYLTLRALRAKAIVTHRLWDVRAPGSAPNDIENGCGLTDLQGRHKPAFAALLRLRR